MNRPFQGFSPQALDLLVRNEWRGNVRELANAVERALVVGTPPTVEPDDLPIRRTADDEDVSDSLAHMERRHIGRVLESHEGNVTRAAGRGAPLRTPAQGGGARARARLRPRALPGAPRA